MSAPDSKPKHSGAIESELLGGYFATCSCGFKSEECHGMIDAEVLLMKHYDEVAL